MSRSHRSFGFLDADALFKARHAAGLQQDELAEKIGGSQQQVSGWERGRNGCRIGTLHKLAEALGVPPEQLMVSLDQAPAGGSEQRTAA